MPRTCVLVVEHNAALRHVVRAWLTAAGFDVLTAASEDEACAEAEEAGEAGRRIDAVVCGWDHDAEPGTDVVARLGRLEVARHAPVLLVSERPHDLPAWVLRRTAVRAVIARPFGPRSLAAQVGALLATDPGPERVAA